MERGSGAYDAEQAAARQEVIKKRDTVKNAAAKAEKDWVDDLTKEGATDKEARRANTSESGVHKKLRPIEEDPVVRAARERALAKQADAKKLTLAKEALDARAREMAQEKERANYESRYAGISAIGDSAVSDHLAAIKKEAPPKKGFLGSLFGKKEAQTVFDEAFDAAWNREDVDRNAKLIQAQTGFSSEQSRLIAAFKALTSEQRPQAEALLKKLASGT